MSANGRTATPSGQYDLAVIGAGPAGISAAREAAGLGARVALVERDRLGGTCLNVGCVPSKAIIRSSRLVAEVQNAQAYGAQISAKTTVGFPEVMGRMRRLRARVVRALSVERLGEVGVDVFLGEARFTAGDAMDVDGSKLRFEKAMIATGSRPERPSIRGLTEADYLTNENVFDLTECPRSLLVIGGGPLGCELAQAFCRLGARTTIVQRRPLFLPKEERDAAQILSDAFARNGIDVRLNTLAVGVRVTDGQKHVELVSDDYRSTITTDAILTGIGRLPNVEGMDLEKAGVAFDTNTGIVVDDFLRTSNPRIYAAGDVCLEHKFAHAAEASARIVVQNALRGGNQRLSALIIPWCTFTDPEIAHVGLHVRQALEQDIPVKTFTVPMQDVVRAITDGEDVGFAKIHVEEGTDHILGATIVARHAGEMISEITLAMVAGIGLRTLARVIHPSPTQSGAIKMAADACSRTR